MLLQSEIPPNTHEELPSMIMKDESQTESMNINLSNTTEENGTSGSNSMSDRHQNTSEDDTSQNEGTLVVPEEIDPKGSFCCGCNGGDDTASRFKARTIFWCWAVVTVLIVAAGTLTAVAVLANNTTGNATSQPSSASTSTDIPRTESYYQERYERFVRTILRTMEGDASYSVLITATNTPQYQALQWLVDDDTTVVSHDDDQNSLDMTTTTIAPIEQTKLIQRYTMMVLYYACGGEAWQMSSNAGSIQGLGHIDTCDWGSLLDLNFIECDTTTQEVVQLHLDQQRLIGQLPHELFLLSSLVSLDLSYNFLKGDIPTNMFDQMVKLRKFTKRNYRHVSSLLRNRCFFISLTVPCPRAETLRLNNNEFVGPLPTSIGRLQSLQQMMLGFNFFTGSIPKEYVSLTELQHFHVKDVPSLRGPFFPVIGEQWSKLQFLILDGTGLTGTIPSQVITSWNDSLVELKLGESLFSGTFPTEIGSLTQLTNFDCSSQNMNGPFPNVTTLTNLGKWRT